jgi:thiamine monophosphate synthase
MVRSVVDNTKLTAGVVLIIADVVYVAIAVLINFINLGTFKLEAGTIVLLLAQGPIVGL